MCSTCGNRQCNLSSDKCYEARLSLGVREDKSEIVGSLDRVSMKPIPIKPFVQANETVTTLRYDPDKRALVYKGERADRQNGSADYVTSAEILSGATMAELGGVGQLNPGGIGIATVTGDNKLQVLFEIPDPIEANELSSGFLTYVENPNDGASYLRLIRPNLGGSSDSILIGHPNGDMEFSSPIDSPLIVPKANLKSNGHFSGAPATASGTWRYQDMGTSQVVTNTSGSRIEVTLNFRYSMETVGTRSGVYCTLQNGGADYQTEFIDGYTSVKQEGYPGGYGEFKTVLEPNQKCQFAFGAWTNAAGSMVCVIGSVDESSGSTVYTVNEPTISIRRLI